MTKAQQALRKWAQWNPGVDFDQACDYCLSTDGLVYIGPDGVLLLADHGDTWGVQLAVGDLGRLFQLAPYPKRFIAWGRVSRGRPTPVVCRWDRFASLLGAGRGLKP